ncbi:extracellular solute-binding protein [Butyrivibrio sp. NC2002]|uniref:extracellular solute-binding protein n=1 Tax=Butyrivibrio sp. NC2002 TaxID=1410610 RepID=UPI00055F7DB1|nr:extracellular solute-binding protein [Butyrivibrio sp. NC2002]
MKGFLFKRLIIAGTAILMLTGSAGCAEANIETAYNSNDDANSITCMVWDRGTFPEGKNGDDNGLAIYIRENVKKELGIEVHFVDVPRDHSDEEIEKMMEDGTIPDIFFTYSPSVFGYMTKQGKVTEIGKEYDEYCTNIQEYIGDIQYMGEYNDKRIAVMKRRGFRQPRHLAYIRKDWCDALGMDVPKNKEELFEYLYAVKEKNPGNVDGVIPWGMGGNTNSEKFYHSFVCSYVDDLSERDSFIYSERFIVFAKGAMDGIREMNKLYNDGIISLDFAADTDDSKFVDDIESGKVGFFVDDALNPFSYIETLKKNVKDAELVPLLCFDTKSGEYINVTEPLYGMYIMVPSKSKEKLPAIMKYLNWLADPDNAIKINYAPGYEETEGGAPLARSIDELNAEGYPGHPDDYCIVNGQFPFMTNKRAQVSIWAENCKWESYDWFENLYDVCLTNQYTFPSTSVILESEARYQTAIEQSLVREMYNLISCPVNDFDREFEVSYGILKGMGLEEILNERAGYYDSGELKIGK